MPDEIRRFTATIPAGTPIAAPVTVAIAFPARKVVQVDWRVPPGPLGQFGWQLTMGGVIVLPVQPENPGLQGDKFVVASDHQESWPLVNQPDSGAWQVTGYNTGNHPHSVYLAFHLELPELPQLLRPLIAPHELGSAPDLSAAGPPVALR